MKPFTALISTIVPAALAATSISLSLTLLNSGGSALQPLPLVPAVDGPASRVATVLEAPTRVLSPGLRQAGVTGTEGAPRPAPEATAPKPVRVSVQPRPPTPAPPAPTPPTPTPPTPTPPPRPSPPVAVLAVHAPPPRSHVHGKAKAFGRHKPKASEREQSVSAPHGKAKGHKEGPLRPPKMHEPKVHEPRAPEPKEHPAAKKPEGRQAPPSPQPPATPEDPKSKHGKDKGGDAGGNGGGKK